MIPVPGSLQRCPPWRDVRVTGRIGRDDVGHARDEVDGARTVAARRDRPRSSTSLRSQTPTVLGSIDVCYAARASRCWRGRARAAAAQRLPLLGSRRRHDAERRLQSASRCEALGRRSSASSSVGRRVRALELCVTGAASPIGVTSFTSIAYVCSFAAACVRSIAFPASARGSTLDVDRAPRRWRSTRSSGRDAVDRRSGVRGQRRSSAPRSRRSRPRCCHVCLDYPLLSCRRSCASARGDARLGTIEASPRPWAASPQGYASRDRRRRRLVLGAAHGRWPPASMADFGLHGRP